MHAYVSTTLGPSFADPPAAKLSDIFADSSATTPLILTVSQGADAMAELGAFAALQGRGVGRSLVLLSLGQGQGPVAEALVRVAMRNGDWVCLQVRLILGNGFRAGSQGSLFLLDCAVSLARTAHVRLRAAVICGG